MKLNGTCNHHDLGALGAAVNNRAIEKRLQMLKDMGVNALRTSHNPPAPELLDIADRLGLMVMDEAFDCWYAARIPTTTDDSSTSGMTRTSRLRGPRSQHPSVIIWSIGNEVAQAGDTATVQKLMTSVHAKDTTRPSPSLRCVGCRHQHHRPRRPGGINYAPDRYDSVHTSNPTYKMFASESSSACVVEASTIQQQPRVSYDDPGGLGGGRGSVMEQRHHARLDCWRVHLDGLRLHWRANALYMASKSSYFGAIDTAYMRGRLLLLPEQVERQWPDHGHIVL